MGMSLSPTAVFKKLRVGLYGGLGLKVSFQGSRTGIALAACKTLEAGADEMTSLPS